MTDAHVWSAEKKLKTFHLHWFSCLYVIFHKDQRKRRLKKDIALFDATHCYRLKSSSPQWSLETVRIAFSFCHIANEQAAINHIAFEINCKWLLLQLLGEVKRRANDRPFAVSFSLIEGSMSLSVLVNLMKVSMFTSPSLVSLIRFPPPGSWRYYEQWLAGVIIDINHHLPQHIRTMCIIKPPAKVKIMKSLWSFPSKWQD